MKHSPIANCSTSQHIILVFFSEDLAKPKNVHYKIGNDNTKVKALTETTLRVLHTIKYRISAQQRANV